MFVIALDSAFSFVFRMFSLRVFCDVTTANSIADRSLSQNLITNIFNRNSFLPRGSVHALPDQDCSTTFRSGWSRFRLAMRFGTRI